MSGLYSSLNSAVSALTAHSRSVELAGKNLGWGNAAQVGGAYLGSAIGAGLFLFLVDIHGWRAAVSAMAALLVVLGLPFLLGLSSVEGAATTEHGVGDLVGDYRANLAEHFADLFDLDDSAA